MRILSRPFLYALPKTNSHTIRGFATQLPYTFLQNPFNNTIAAAAAEYDNKRRSTPTSWAMATASWHLPDLSIEERASRLSQAVDIFTAKLRGAIFVAYKGEVKGNPTESEADVAADRSDDDPLPPEKHHTIPMPAGDLAPKPTEAEEDVRADYINDDVLDRLFKKGIMKK
ncbi:hypothetical protein V8F33_013871 [Rhypophila sp. PSN 637]